MHQGVNRVLNEERGSGWEVRDWGGEAILHQKKMAEYTKLDRCRNMLIKNVQTRYECLKQNTADTK